eukprot:8088396-Lingulodinium_polyedra.AAC.1
MELIADQIAANGEFLRIRRTKRAEHDRRVSGMTQAERAVAYARRRAQTATRSGGKGKASLPAEDLR